ncbi:hypothetical protein AMELA_G00136930 [Ameiurus melas]|uniref:Uncharacterized protein n=1 Tax=Ameiurus melas TaxID=219545 RepID=A0A7J6AKG6_AMEME|nr:hypothetical protein AMELA_G00136930 [Ameiurus melas]
MRVTPHQPLPHCPLQTPPLYPRITGSTSPFPFCTNSLNFFFPRESALQFSPFRLRSVSRYKNRIPGWTVSTHRDSYKLSPWSGSGQDKWNSELSKRSD